MKNRTKSLIISFTCGAFAVLAGFTAKYKQDLDGYRRAERYAQMQAMSQLAESMNDMSDSLILGVYAYSPELLTSAAAKIWNSALSAASSLSYMPFRTSDIEKTQGFINKAGDFAYYIAHHASSGKALSAEEREQLMKLSEKTRDLSKSIYDTETVFYYGNGSFPDEDLGSFKDIETGFDEFTFIDYDGALTSSVVERGAGEIAGEAETDEETARKRASQALDCGEERFNCCSESAGNIPAYVFSDEDGNTVSVTKNGGYILAVKRDGAAGEALISAAEAIENGLNYLAKLGYKDMKPVYYQIPDDSIHIEYVYSGKNVRAYPDKINVVVSLYDGLVTRLDAAEYLVCHADRPDGIMLSREDELSFLPEGLRFEYVGAAIVSSEGKCETLCREYLCGDESGRIFTMYLDAESGEQKQIKIVDQTDCGTFII